MSEQLYQVALELLPGIGDVTAKNLIAYCGSASEIFKAPKQKLAKVPGIGPKTLSLLQSEQPLKEAEDILNRCEKAGISIHHFTDSTYPTKLKQAVDAPNILYAKGNINAWSRVLAIVGTRNATEYGRTVTERIVAECKDLDVVIVSGLAYGIDITAHRAALREHVPTIGVLAGGLDKLYPSAHKKYADEMLETGGLISENPPGIKAEAHFFPARNRIIAGMCDAVVVVEAAKKGGALITANIADSYNKTVFAVPGTLEHTYSEGCNYLIRNQKALIYTGIKDLKYHLNWDQVNGNAPQAPDLSALPEGDRRIMEILQNHPEGIPVDELAWRTQISLNQLASNLLGLEFQGLVKSLPGKRYRVA
ncbi:DNA-processing protein DprA [Marinoscillum furvescens]|uniref:DNA processing protein n=1 Tax=Marinoscillum furvescens DSM 4134 TaxID=1122208 RepID=A0A3D9L152_MARFU|nr:DNA-processing protein DprA [Marinoscillum furvescens]RED95605.1 DNA processing protein [Marinoscillum furvescens DSM 4134]